MYKILNLFLLCILISACSDQAKETKKETPKSITPPSKQETPSKKQETTLPSGPLKLAYIGNMGVLMESGDKTILIDGLHEQYKPEYAYPKQEDTRRLISGTYPGFTRIEAVLATHNHKDHASPKLLGDFIKYNKNALIITSSQIKKEVTSSQEITDLPTSSRIREVLPNGAPSSVKYKGIMLRGINGGHTNKEKHSSIENVVFFLNFDNYNVLHLGDSDWSTAKKSLKNLGVKSTPIDIAILPYWMLLEETSVDLIKSTINPKQIIASHIPPNFSKKQQKEILANHPNTKILSVLNEKFEYQKSSE